MMGMMDFYPHPWAKNVWTPWVKYLTDKSPDCSVEQAALVKLKKTYTAACSKNFQLSASDIQAMTNAFEDKSVDHIDVHGQLYKLLPRSFTSDPSLLVATSSSHYIVIGASYTMYLVALVKKSGGPADSDHVRNTAHQVHRMIVKLSLSNY
jgi:hypothetical protein